MFSLARDQDSICAICTPAGRGAIAVVRLSGPRAVQISRALASFLPEHPESHKIYYGYIRHPGAESTLGDSSAGVLIDEVLLSYFAEGRSFTGESTVEISCHGGPAVAQQVLAALIAAGARMAQNGEFTYRAFMNGRIDLVQAEAVLAVIESESVAGSRMALRQLKGELSEKFLELEDQLTWVLSRLEANLDFSAEFIEFAAETELVARTEHTLAQVRALLGTYEKGRILRDGLRVALVGAPNVGKSSLLNALIAQDRSIVSPIAGTTRDTVEAEISLDGHKLVLIDTAGLRNATDEIEALGVERAHRAVAEADIVAFIYDVSSTDSIAASEFLSVGKPTLRIANKGDLLGGREIFSGDILVSAKNGDGLSALQNKFREYLFRGREENSALVQNSRHYEQLLKTEEHLIKGLSLMKTESSPEFVIAEIQEGLVSILDILGRRFDDNVLDRVFKDFCLGK